MSKYKLTQSETKNKITRLAVLTFYKRWLYKRRDGKMALVLKRRGG